MANLTTVGITSGVPSSGTGTVSTIDNLLLLGNPISNSSNVIVNVLAASSVVTSTMATLAVQVSSLSPARLVNLSSNPTVTLSSNPTLAGGTVTLSSNPTVTLSSNPTVIASSIVYVQINDGTTILPVLAANSGAPAASAPAIAVSQRDANSNGLANSSQSSPVVIAPQTTDIAVTPVVSTTAYVANNVLGGIMTFSSVLPSVGLNGVLQSITAKFKGSTVTSTLNVAIFKQSPSGGTYTDHSSATWSTSDAQFLIGIYQLGNPVTLSPTSSMTCYNLDGIGKSFVGSSTSLFAVVTVSSTPTLNTTAEFTLQLSVLPG